MTVSIKKQMVEVSRLMYGKGLVNAFEGNLSVRDGERIYITPSRICKGFLTEDMIVVTDMEGNTTEGRFKVSSEIKLHLGSYKVRPDVRSVIHTHSPYATAYALANRPIETRAYPEMITFFEKIPLAPYGTPSTDEVFLKAEEYIKDYDVVLLANHGIMGVGADPYDAFFKVESAESIAKTLLLAERLGGAKELEPEKLEELYKLKGRAGVPFDSR
ncbi:MAG: class II aldolase/adducin family protein [Clostridiales bacterium]|nr:class II aldolase/adducin family protein [Eubacteriales bacterium]MDH7566415.1 class II aldolase/adducin family protein [Clostridiales bacterium]